VRRDCLNLKRNNVANVVASGKVDSKSDYDILVLSSEKSCNGEPWLLDSTSSYHATPRKEWFSSYVECDFGFTHLKDCGPVWILSTLSQSA
jgi:hypothetical protein